MTTMEGGQVGRVSVVMTVVGALGVVIAAFLPWVETGSRGRTSFQVMRAADLLDVVSGPGRVALRAWYLVPALAAAVWLAAALHHPRLVAVLGALLAIAAVAASIVVLTSGINAGPGPTVALVAGALTAVGALLTARSSWRTT